MNSYGELNNSILTLYALTTVLSSGCEIGR